MALTIAHDFDELGDALAAQPDLAQVPSLDALAARPWGDRGCRGINNLAIQALIGAAGSEGAGGPATRWRVAARRRRPGGGWAGRLSQVGCFRAQGPHGRAVEGLPVRPVG
jgi:hypothetical protein